MGSFRNTQMGLGGIRREGVISPNVIYHTMNFFFHGAISPQGWGVEDVEDKSLRPKVIIKVF